ncbi:unnamed protein product [Kuraishia capsulata CBS 1993]|uniref:Cytochrome c oxidase assembly factor 6 n=1 Tax=Kuraishia capsulata CBS 1993 TaxID=1382522 RepID=W6MWQ0_9ASCO|nr:uncharacterized protein KUCA_T00003709001 [Kuraishia capsulata CBS 1993]CDK27730.1 unnamed protein product [Kuraishia capsulata CBS 1993]
MGLFRSDPVIPDPPNRSKREKCWESRDLFFSCLDRIDVVNPLDKKHDKIIAKECSKENKQYETDCVASWVKYFNQKRPFDIKKERMLKEAEEQNAEVIQMPGYRPGAIGK